MLVGLCQVFSSIVSIFVAFEKFFTNYINLGSLLVGHRSSLVYYAVNIHKSIWNVVQFIASLFHHLMLKLIGQSESFFSLHLKTTSFCSGDGLILFMSIMVPCTIIQAISSVGSMTIISDNLALHTLVCGNLWIFDFGGCFLQLFL